MLSLSTKPLLITCFVLLSLTSLFAYLSYSFYGDLKKAEQSYTLALNANKQLEKSLDKQQMLCKKVDDIAVEFKEEEKKIEQNTEKHIEKIDSLSSPSREVSKHEIDIDSELPLALHCVLSESYRNTQRPTDNSSR